MKGIQPANEAGAKRTVLALAGAAVLAAGAMTAPTPGAAEEVLSSIVRGGRLYDNWHKEARKPAPMVPHPAFPLDRQYAMEPEGTWRCKECHGWDYLGRDGAYAEGKHFTGIKGIRAMAGADPAEIIAVLRDDTHRYRGLMEDHDFRALGNFVSMGQVDMDRFIDRASATARGDETRRAAYYETICARCHGADGRKVTTMPPLGKVAKGNPWEALHKILNGHPDEKMPALRVLDRKILGDVLAFIQTLPTEK